MTPERIEEIKQNYSGGVVGELLAALEEAQQLLEKAIDKPRLLSDLHAKMDRFEGERQRGVAGAVGAIESGKYDLGVSK